MKSGWWSSPPLYFYLYLPSLIVTSEENNRTMNIISKLIKYIKDKKAAKKEAEFQRMFKAELERQKETEEIRKYLKDNNIDITITYVSEKPVEEENWEFIYGMKNPFD